MNWAWAGSAARQGEDMGLSSWRNGLGGENGKPGSPSFEPGEGGEGKMLVKC